MERGGGSISLNQSNWMNVFKSQICLYNLIVLFRALWYWEINIRKIDGSGGNIRLPIEKKLKMSTIISAIQPTYSLISSLHIQMRTTLGMVFTGRWTVDCTRTDIVKRGNYGSLNFLVPTSSQVKCFSSWQATCFVEQSGPPQKNNLRRWGLLRIHKVDCTQI